MGGACFDEEWEERGMILCGFLQPNLLQPPEITHSSSAGHHDEHYNNNVSYFPYLPMDFMDESMDLGQCTDSANEIFAVSSSDVVELGRSSNSNKGGDSNGIPVVVDGANNYNASAGGEDGNRLILAAPTLHSPSSSKFTTTTTLVEGLICRASSCEIGHARRDWWCSGPSSASPEKSVVVRDTRKSCPSAITLAKISSSSPSSRSESVRRRQITRLFSALRDLFPSMLIPLQLNDKCKLIDYTCQYIGELENKLVKLKRKIKILKRMNANKLHRLQHQSQSSSLDQVQIAHMQVASSCGGEVVNISLGCYGKALSFSTLLRILDMRGLDVLSANCSLSCNTTLYAIHSKVKDSTSSFSSMDIENLQMELKFKAR